MHLLPEDPEERSWVIFDIDMWLIIAAALGLLLVGFLVMAACPYGNYVHCLAEKVTAREDLPPLP